MKLKFLFPIVLLLLIFFNSCKNNDKTLLIATAANMQFTVDELIFEFEKETGIKCKSVIGSSGKLTAQISEGAPFDVFISADTKYPNQLYIDGFGETAPKIYGYGSIILWTLNDTFIPSIKILDSDAVKHIALANSKTAPYGVASEEILKYYNCYEKLKSKFVVGESIGQTNQFIISKAADIGFTAKSVVLNPTLKNKGKYIEIDKNTYQPIAQSALLLKNNSINRLESEKFYNFLFSKKGIEILEQNGYITNLNE